MGTPVTIPAKLHAEMLRGLQAQYEAEFGALDVVRPYTREALVAKYAADLQFWQARLPAMDRVAQRDLRIICAHAIATNAIANMWRLCDERGIRDDVQATLDASVSTDAGDAVTCQVRTPTTDG